MVMTSNRACWGASEAVGAVLAPHERPQKREAAIALNVINRMTKLGMPESVKVAA